MEPSASTTTQTKKRSNLWLLDLLMILILLGGAYFRLVGIYWGEYQYLHPDERFLVWVGSDISPVKDVVAVDPTNPESGTRKVWVGLSDYFDTKNSPLNPNNRGHGFYVYGTLPMFLTRYLVEFIFGRSGFAEMTQVGRPLSALFDIFSIILVYLVARKLYDRRVGLLAAAFSAAAVLQIQQSHFFTMETFLDFFTLLAFYFAVRISVDANIWGRKEPESGAAAGERAQAVEVFNAPEGEPAGTRLGIVASPRTATLTNQVMEFVKHPLFLPSLGFGLALGAATASKLNGAAIALALPAAMGIRLVMLPPEERERRTVQALLYLVMAAFVSLLVFRIFQPYAFSGPGFFGLKPNPAWVANIREQRAQSSGDVDFPPAMQWARRSVTFSGKNLVLWGLGLPLGILAWAGFLWAGWRMLRGDWQRHALIWGWTAFYFTWQSLALNPTMRYQLLIYPMLAIFAAWAVVRLYDNGRERLRWPRTVVPALLVGGMALLGTYGWAFAFSRVYARPITRIEGTRWVYQNIPGPINLRIQTDSGVYNQPLPMPYGYVITPGVAYQAPFSPNTSGAMREVFLPHILDQQGSGQARSLTVTISGNAAGQEPLASATVRADFAAGKHPRGDGYTFTLDKPVVLQQGQTYYIQAALSGTEAGPEMDGDVSIRLLTPEGIAVSQTLPPSANFNRPALPYSGGFLAQEDGSLQAILLTNITDPRSIDQINGLTLSYTLPGEEPATETAALTAQVDPNGQGYILSLNPQIPILQGVGYQVMLGVQPNAALITLSGDGIANEGDWDDALPLRMDGYDGFGGIYPLDLNFNMYWEDSPEKLDRFTRILGQSDYILITSSRQWGSLPRLPERFPMTTVYYRSLLGCPPEKDIYWCYSVAKPGMFKSELGFDLVQVFQSDPSIGPLRINDQFAEEAFTVYDHPKVLVFKKAQDYDQQKAQALLGSVDFSQIVRVPPMRAGSQPANLLLPVERLSEQYSNGTWSELFDTQALQNRFQWLSVIVWYLSVFLLGVFTFPMLRLALPGLSDGGYPLARTAGMLLLSYLVWLAGSFRLPFTRLTISVALALMALAGAYFAYRQRDDLRQMLRSRGRYFLMIEGLMLAFFMADLLIRLGNPDLWHPWKGGEKPMDFSYFNAVLKSTSFPPYDPWYEGGYLNYYYYGFVLVGVLVKWLGIVPAIAYNLILPTLFSMIAMGAFSIGWNLFKGSDQCTAISDQPPSPPPLSRGERGEEGALIPLAVSGEDDGAGDSLSSPPTQQEQVGAGNQQSANNNLQFLAGLAAALGAAVLGNLGTVRMIYQGYQRLAAPGGVIEGASILTRWIWAAKGFVQVLAGAQLPYSLGDWYWIPSRAIPAPGDIEPITEFPFFTILYADPHAHLFALPVTLLALAFALSVVLARGRWKCGLGAATWLGLGAMAIGALRPTNTWDFPVYLALAVVALGYALLMNFHPTQDLLRRLPFLDGLPAASLKLVAAGAAILMLVGLSVLFYQPFADWYALGYRSVDLWKGTHTPFWSYLTHWGLFLFVIVSWMAWETRDWLASTPVSSLRKLEPYRGLIAGALLLVLALMAGLAMLKVGIGYFVLPLAAWAGVLLLRPGQPDAKRFVLFLVGTGLVLTLVVEVIVLRGDIGRMNTVFKFYLQVWTLFATSAAAALAWLLLALPQWLPGWRNVWQAGLALLVAGAALFPIMGGMAKVKDRMSPQAPHTLDGMAFMDYSHYADEWGDMDLSQDYRAIRWMQENVTGSPVIVEANLRNLYRWGSRYTIYTGLPAVVGWEWHEQQQRAVIPSTWITNRILEVDNFYLTTSLDEAQAFLRKYDVGYIIVGQQERGHYPGPGLDKFDAANGSLWKEVYRNEATVIYQVLPQ